MYNGNCQNCSPLFGGQTPSRPHKRVHLVSGEKSIQINTAELGLTYTYDEPLQKAYLIGREGTLFDKATSKYKASWGITFQPDYQWNDHVLAEALTKHLSTLNIPAGDARFCINPDNSLQIAPKKPGKQVDIDSLIASIKKQTPNDAQKIQVHQSSHTNSYEERA